MYSSSMRTFAVDVSNGIIEISIVWKNGQTMNLTREVCFSIAAGDIVASGEIESMTSK